MEYEPSRVTRAFARARNIVLPNVVITPPPEGVTLDRDLAVAVRDGARLRVNVFRPAEDGTYPVLMAAHPYGKDDLPDSGRGRYRPSIQYRMLPQSRTVRFSAWTGWEAPDPGYWVPRGYVVVNADLRGWGTSEGAGELLNLRQEGEDYHDLIEWAAGQEWSNGRVGLAGVSYLAITQWAAAATRPRHLAAICPWEGFTDTYRDFARPGGVREDGFLVVWDRMAKLRARKRPEATADLREQQRARPEYDEWWASRAAALDRIEVPALVCGSFSDQNLHTPGSFAGFSRIAATRKWLYTHRGPKWATYYDSDALAAQTRFFDHFLAGTDNGQDEQPPVRLEVRADCDTITSVRGEQQWPPAATRWQRWHLDAATGALDEHPPERAAAPSFDTRRGRVSFTRRFTTDTEIVGPMLLRLTVEARQCSDLALFAGVRKLRYGRPIAFESSYGFRGSLVTFGMRRASHRRTGTAPYPSDMPFHPDDVAEPLRPGEIVTVQVELHPSATLFRAGEELRLDVQCRWFYGRFPLTTQFPAYYERSPRGRCVLHTGPDASAHLDVPVQAAG